MDRVRIPRKGGVIVCDGSKAVILRNEGDAGILKLETIEVLEEKHPPTSAMGTDRPGRVHQSLGNSRSSVEETDWHAQAEAAFLAKVAETLERFVREDVVTTAVLIAPPKALGVLRETFTPAARAAITAEIAKDLTGMPVRDIEKYLATL